MTLFIKLVNLPDLTSVKYMLQFVNKDFILKTKLFIRMDLFFLHVHGSVHLNINIVEITNKMQPRSRIYYSNVS